MSAEQHAREAERHAQVAQAHAEQYNEKSTSTHFTCSPQVSICWTSVENPTEEHLREAEIHRTEAARHRAASAALREAEASACVGIAAHDRDMSPFEHVEDITAVQPLVEERRSGPKGPAVTRVAGAEVTLRAVPGLTAEWLQRLVDCHLARNAALGHVVEEMPNCPLVPRGAMASVSSTGDGFTVSIRADDDAAARDILARAERLQAARRGERTVSQAPRGLEAAEPSTSPWCYARASRAA